MASVEIENLIKAFSRLPGVGARSARRIALHMIKKKDSFLEPMISAIKQVKDNVVICPICGNYDTSSPCDICQNPKRDEQVLCVVEDVSDLWAMERTSFFKGRYHILGGVLSALDGIGPDELNLKSLLSRVDNEEIKEIILALPATIDGQTTSYYIAEHFKDTNVKISALAHGIPVGGELDYLDDDTIKTALNARKIF